MAHAPASRRGGRCDFTSRGRNARSGDGPFFTPIDKPRCPNNWSALLALFRSPRDLLCDFLEGVSDDLRKRGMIPRGAQEIEDGGLHGERAAETMEELAGVLADDFSAEDAAAGRLGYDLHVAVIGVHQDGLAVIIEWIRG